MKRVGVWLVGACGGVGTLTVCGARAIARGLADSTGMVTDLEELRALALVEPADLVFGGHETGGQSLVEAADEFRERSGVLTTELIAELAPDLEEAYAEVRRGLPSPGRGDVAVGPRGAVASVQEDLLSFRDRHDLGTVVVVNVATTEPEAIQRPEWAGLEALQDALKADRAEVFPTSMLYAYAALDLGFPYVNFTPSTGASVPALDDLARERRCVHAGRDGKTGETLVKSALAPIFMGRNLQVLAWEGYNMLGNRDGEALQRPEIRGAKTSSKDRALQAILDGRVDHSSVHIDYVPSLDDWKVAFDYIHFRGFLGARMAMQFTWQGCDSVLAAPLILDLARLCAFSQGRGETGSLRHLACFFKDPYGCGVHSFHGQFDLLRDYVHDALRDESLRANRTA